ncbi:MAG: hypothetical protein N0E58_19420 [Candidatus Thiodiazotropha endolucinida]|uniref:Uncharacterized protein n=1 Tax=Candidatus Thiodiazotropha taylori TaxID=2792791 RepID=A0A9E4NN08_9GAMM|nr:hypothetical protein [Candidatus Thiodiazotropha taylori]MCW4238421.1 hypothetical protein [Candidatus Thiodiazotropha endolucinida]
MSAPNGVNFRNAGKSTSEDGINPATAAAMCSGMPPLWWSAARLKWADDTSGIKMLYNELSRLANQLKDIEQWRIPKDRDYIDKFAMLALLEVTQPTKWKHDSHKADFIGMDKSVFYRTWKKRYEVIYRQVDDWCSSALSYIYKINSTV